MDGPEVRTGYATKRLQTFDLLPLRAVGRALRVRVRVRVRLGPPWHPDPTPN